MNFNSKTEYILWILLMSFNFSKFASSKLLINFSVTPLNYQANISKAIYFLIDKFFIINKFAKSFDIITEFSDQSYKKYEKDILDDILPNINNKTIHIDCAHKFKPTYSAYFNLMLIDSSSSFRNIFLKSSMENFNYEGFYLIFLHSSKNDYVKEMLEIFESCYQLNIINVNIVIEKSSNLILIYTYFPNSKNGCDIVKPTLINQFSNNKLKTEKLFPWKMRNFHKCFLKISIWSSMPFIYTIINSTNQEPKFIGLEGEILQNLKYKLNFRVKLFGWKTSTIYPNGNVTGTYKKLQDGEYNMIIGRFRYTNVRASIFTPTISYYQVPIVLVIRKGLPYSPIEKLLFPFATVTWIYFLTVIFIGVLVIVGSRYTNNSTRTFVLGHNNNLPILNMLNSLLGGGVYPEPKRNFSRFLLMIWLLGTLVLRSSYQGALFAFIQSELEKFTPNSINDILSQNYDIFVTDTVYAHLNSIPDVQKRAHIMNASEFDGFTLLRQTDEKKSILGPEEYIAVYMDKYQESKGILHIIKERVLSQRIVIYLNKNSFLRHPIDTVLINFSSSGLIDYWTQKYIHQTIYKKKKGNTLKKLTNYNLLGIYQIYGIFIITSIGIFILELLSIKVYILRKFFESVVN